MLDQDSFLENFDRDRNIILKIAQNELFETLAKRLVEIVIEKYNQFFNPLGLIDSTYERILQYQFTDLSSLQEVYENLSVAYRFKYGDNQLEIIWDGTTHERKYAGDWQRVFEEWIDTLSNQPTFVKTVILLTALKEEDTNAFFLQNHLKGIVNDHFEMKVLKRNGVKRVVIKTKLNKSA